MKLKQRIASLLADSDFRAPVLKLVSGQGVALVIGYVASLVLMRIYADEYWGIVDYIVSWTTILTPVASLRYEDALMLPESKRQSAHAYLLAVAASVISCFVILGILLSSETVIEFFAKKEIGHWSLFIPLALLVHRISKITELWLTRQDSFSLISAGQVVTVGSMTGIRGIVGFISPGAGGLISGFIAGYFLSAVAYSRRGWKTLKASLVTKPSWEEIRYVAKRYKRFPMFTMPAALLGALIMRLPFLILPEFLDWGTMGQFSRGFNVLFVPLSLLAASVAQVFFVRAVQSNRDGGLAQFSSNVHSKLVMMSIFPTTVLMVAGGDIFQIMFGIEWRASGEFLLFMAPWIMLSIIASPMTRIFDVLEKQRIEFIVAIIMSLVMFAALMAGGQSQDTYKIIMILGIAGSAVRIGQIILLLRLSGANLLQTVLPYAKYLAIMAPIIAAILFVRTLDVPLYTFISVFLGGVAFAAYILKTERLLAHKG